MQGVGADANQAVVEPFYLLHDGVAVALAAAEDDQDVRLGLGRAGTAGRRTGRVAADAPAIPAIDIPTIGITMIDIRQGEGLLPLVPLPARKLRAAIRYLVQAADAPLQQSHGSRVAPCDTST